MRSVVVFAAALLILSPVERAIANHCLPGFLPFATKMTQGMAQARSARARGDMPAACAAFNSAVAASRAGLAYVRQPSCGHPEYKGRPQNLVNAAAANQQVLSARSLFCGGAKPQERAEEAKQGSKETAANSPRSGSKQLASTEDKGSNPNCPAGNICGKDTPDRPPPPTTEPPAGKAAIATPKPSSPSPPPDAKPSGADTTERELPRLQPSVSLPESFQKISRARSRVTVFRPMLLCRQRGPLRLRPVRRRK